MDNINPNERLYSALASVPIGTIIAYGELCSAAGLPGRDRCVWRLLSQLPCDTQLPWHRVTNAQRRISFPLGSDRFFEQSARLQREGLQISSTGKVSLPN